MARSRTTPTRTLKRETDRVANAFRGVGIVKGDRVFFLSDRIPELYFGVFGALKLGAIAAPLFSAFGPEPIRERVARADGKAIVTTPKLLPKVDAIRDRLPSLETVIVIDTREETEVADGDVAWSSIYGSASTGFTIEQTGPEDWSIMHFTSGTTGLPKGAAHVHNTVVSHYATGKYVLDLHEDDIYWCTADPGWVTGTSYGMFAPWSNGITQVIDEGGFSARRWYETIVRHGVTVWYTAPHRDPPAHEGRLCARPQPRSLLAALRHVGRGAAQPRGSGSGVRRPSICRSTTTGGRPRPARS